MATRKIIDLSSAPYIVELRDDGKYYIVGIKVRKRELIFEGNGLPADVVEKIEGDAGNGKIDGIQEIEDFLEGQEEDTKLEDIVPSEYVSDEDMTNEWQKILNNATPESES